MHSRCPGGSALGTPGVGGHKAAKHGLRSLVLSVESHSAAVCGAQFCPEGGAVLRRDAGARLMQQRERGPRRRGLFG